MLALAAGGAVESRDLTFEILSARRTREDALNGYLPEQLTQVVYMRDWPRFPESAQTLAEDDAGRAVVWQLGDNVFAFAGNPGVKLGMIEDLVMEFEEVPANAAESLEKLREIQGVIGDELVPLMTGLVQCTSLMATPRAVGELDAQVV